MKLGLNKYYEINKLFSNSHSLLTPNKIFLQNDDKLNINSRINSQQQKLASEFVGTTTEPQLNN